MTPRVVSAQIPGDWADRLREHGHRVTQQRRTVLEIVWSLRHVTPDQVRGEARKRAQRLDLSTVYRTLELLDEVGLITHAHLGSGSPTYHPVDEKPHLHLVCRSCGAVGAVDAAVVAPVVKQVASATGFEVDIAHLALYGICARCKANLNGTDDGSETDNGKHGN